MGGGGRRRKVRWTQWFLGHGLGLAKSDKALKRFVDRDLAIRICFCIWVFESFFNGLLSDVNGAN